MCNISGYVGDRKAAPVLIEMTRRQEGLDGGFFTGVSTHNGSAIDYRKVKGELATLLAQTDVDKLEGNMGIAHSRTPSGGDGSWSHPFNAFEDGKVKMSYVANGALGLFNTQNDRYNKIADRLVGEGFDIPCKLNLSSNRYNRLSSGENVHMSDLMCQLIYRYKKIENDTVNAMTAAFCEMPGIIVGLAIEEESPDRIYFSRINMPMFVGFDESGAYLATSPIGFPESVKSYTLLPALSSGVVFKNCYEVVPYKDFSNECVPFDEDTVVLAKNLILDILSREQKGFAGLRIALLEHLPQNAVTQENAIVYVALSQLLKKGKIEMLSVRRVVEGEEAPQTLFKLKNELV